MIKKRRGSLYDKKIKFRKFHGRDCATCLLIKPRLETNEWRGLSHLLFLTSVAVLVKICIIEVPERLVNTGKRL